MGSLLSSINPRPIPTPLQKGAQRAQQPIAKNIYDLHNEARATAGLEPLRESKQLADFAKKWAEHLKHQESCAIRHPLNSEEEKNRYLPGSLGQNIYVGHGYPDDPSSPSNVVSAWYDECKDYKTPTGDIPGNFEAVGHFTQLMWKDAKEVGCARVECPKPMTASDGTIVDVKGAVIVCNYDKGNVSGQFPTQVIYTKCPIDLD